MLTFQSVLLSVNVLFRNHPYAITETSESWQQSQSKYPQIPIRVNITKQLFNFLLNSVNTYLVLMATLFTSRKPMRHTLATWVPSCEEQSWSHLLELFCQCARPMWIALGSHKTIFVFTPNSIYHLYSYFFDPPNPNFQLSKLVCLSFMLFISNLPQNFTEISFMIYLTPYC